MRVLFVAGLAVAVTLAALPAQAQTIAPSETKAHVSR